MEDLYAIRKSGMGEDCMQTVMRAIQDTTSMRHCETVHVGSFDDLIRAINQLEFIEDRIIVWIARYDKHYVHEIESHKIRQLG